MKTKIEEKEEEKEEENPLAWIVKHFHCEGLDPHNLSLDWICETIEEVGATIDIGGENSVFQPFRGVVDGVSFRVF